MFMTAQQALHPLALSTLPQNLAALAPLFSFVFAFQDHVARMLPQAIPVSRSSSQSTDPDSAIPGEYYTRSDQPCTLSFRVGDVVWVRSNGVWALGVVVNDTDWLQTQDSGRPTPAYTVLSYAGSLSKPASLLVLAPLFGSLKPADTYTAALLRAEGVFPNAGTDRADILDLQIKAHAYVELRNRQARMRRGPR